MPEKSPATPLIEAIPDPQTVKRRLSETLREATLLRKLLKLSEQAAKARPRQEVARVAS